MSSTILISGGTLPDGKKSDLLIKDGVIAEIATTIKAEGAEKIDASNAILLPGLVDLHTHLREPGKEDAETVESGSRAGVKGGFTALSAMANTFPDWSSNSRLRG
jgi:dihydroorotase